MRETICAILITTVVSALVPADAKAQDAPQRSTFDPDWADVEGLKPGTAVQLTVRALGSSNGYFLAADDSAMTVLDVGNPAIPDAVRDALRDLASTHPEYFLAAQHGRFELPKHIRLGPDGVSVADRHIVDLAEVVVRYVKQDVGEVRTAETESSRVGCAFAGYFGGAVVGALPGVLVGGAVGRDTGPALVGMMAGWSAGAVHVYGKCRHKPEKVIYAER